MAAARMPAFSFIRDGTGLWLPTAEAGAEVKQLYVDSGDRLTTRLVRLQPQATMPAAPIAGGRSLYVLRGALTADDARLVEGDFADDGATVWQASAPSLVLELAHRASAPEHRVRAAAGASWKELAPGMRMRTLAGRHNSGRECFLLDIAPDHTLEEHEHEGTEELFVIRGSCTIEGRAMARGDYHRAAKGSHHAPTATAEGCLLFVSLRDAERLVA